MNQLASTSRARAAQDAARRTTIVSVLANVLMLFMRAGVGMITGSAALIADAIHSVADLATDILAYVAVRMGYAEADETHPYGHGKFETFGTLVLAVVLTFVAGGIAWEALKLVEHPREGTLSSIALVAAGLSVVGKEIVFRYCLFWGQKVKSNAIIANAWHHRADSLASLAALVGIGAALLGYPAADPIAAVVVAVILLHMAWQLGRGAFDGLVDAALPEDLMNDLRKVITDTPGVRDCHMLRGRRLGAEVVLDVHVDVDPLISVSEGHMIAEKVEHRLKVKVAEVGDVVVHIDPADQVRGISPHQPPREELEEKTRAIVGATLPDATVEHVMLHYIDNRHVADVLLADVPEKVLAKKRDKLQAALTLPQGPFVSVTLALKV